MVGGFSRGAGEAVPTRCTPAMHTGVRTRRGPRKGVPPAGPPHSSLEPDSRAALLRVLSDHPAGTVGYGVQVNPMNGEEDQLLTLFPHENPRAIFKRPGAKERTQHDEDVAAVKMAVKKGTSLPTRNPSRTNSSFATKHVPLRSAPHVFALPLILTAAVASGPGSPVLASATTASDAAAVARLRLTPRTPRFGRA